MRSPTYLPTWKEMSCRRRRRLTTAKRERHPHWTWKSRPSCLLKNKSYNILRFEECLQPRPRRQRKWKQCKHFLKSALSFLSACYLRTYTPQQLGASLEACLAAPQNDARTAKEFPASAVQKIILHILPLSQLRLPSELAQRAFSSQSIKRSKNGLPA